MFTDVRVEAWINTIKMYWDNNQNFTIHTHFIFITKKIYIAFISFRIPATVTLVQESVISVKWGLQTKVLDVFVARDIKKNSVVKVCVIKTAKYAT